MVMGFCPACSSPSQSLANSCMPRLVSARASYHILMECMKSWHSIFLLALLPNLGTCSPVGVLVSQPLPACVSKEPKAWPVLCPRCLRTLSSASLAHQSLGCCFALCSTVRSSSEPGIQCWGREQMWTLPLWNLQFLGEICA